MRLSKQNIDQLLDSLFSRIEKLDTTTEYRDISDATDMYLDLFEYMLTIVKLENSYEHYGYLVTKCESLQELLDNKIKCVSRPQYDLEDAISQVEEVTTLLRAKSNLVCGIEVDDKLINSINNFIKEV
jgi:cell fate (sporulation/competence/biofilm development) regulator YmcA (YheA/YmcA/DUF963 family)